MWCLKYECDYVVIARNGEGCGYSEEASEKVKRKSIWYFRWNKWGNLESKYKREFLFWFYYDQWLINDAMCFTFLVFYALLYLYPSFFAFTNVVCIRKL